MFVPLRKFTPLLEANCVDADRSLLEKMVLLTCVELCQQSWIHREELPAIDAQSGRRVYDVVIPPYIDLIGIKRITLDGSPLEEKIPQTLDRIAPGWRNYPAGSPTWWHLLGKRQFAIIPAPQRTAADSIVATAIYKPSMDAQHVWKRLYEDWHPEIVAGALAKLLKMPGKPWSDLVTAREHEYEFKMGVARAKAEAIKEGGSESLTAYSLTMGV